MPIDGDFSDVDAGATLEAHEIEIFRDEILFPSVNHLSRGKFNPSTALPWANFDLRLTVPEAKTTSRFAVEASGVLEFNPDEPDAPGIPLQTVRIVHETMMPFLQSQDLIEEALASMDPTDASIELILDPKVPTAAWDSRNFTIDTSTARPFEKEKNAEIQDPVGAVLWVDKELAFNDDNPLKDDERKAFYEIRRALDAAMTWDDAELIIQALRGLGLPEKVLQGFLQNLL